MHYSKSKIRKQREGSFYIISKSVNINFYNKEHERLSPNLNKDGAKDLLRLEVQYKKPKTNTIKAKYGFESRYLDHYLNQEVSYQQLEYYYNTTIGTGAFGRLEKRVNTVQVALIGT